LSPFSWAMRFGAGTLASSAERVSSLRAVIQPCRNLFQVVASVDQVKTPPLLRGERSQDRMEQNTGAVTESSLRVSQRCIHGHQSIVEATQRIGPEAVTRYGVLWRLDARGKSSQAEDINGPHAMVEGSAAALRPAGFHSAQQSFGGCGVRKNQVFQHLQRAPLAVRSMGKGINRHRTDCGVGFSPYVL